MKYLGVLCLIGLAACSQGGGGNNNGGETVGAKAMWNPASLSQDPSVLAACRGIDKKNGFYIVVKTTTSTVEKILPASRDGVSAGVNEYAPVTIYAEATELKNNVETSIRKGSSPRGFYSSWSKEDHQTGESEQEIGMGDVAQGSTYPRNEDMLRFQRINGGRWVYQSGPELQGLSKDGLVECIKK
jgi:hypothetical protein